MFNFNNLFSKKESLEVRSPIKKHKKSTRFISEYYFKIIVVGAPGSGKTSFIRRFVKDEFKKVSTSPTHGIEIHSVSALKLKKSKHLLKKFKKPIRIQIFDIPHSESRGNHIDFILKDTHAVFMVFDVTQEKSIQAIDQWRKIIPLGYQCLLIANKADLSNNHVVSPSDLNQYVLNSDYIGWYLTSCKSKLAGDVFDAFDYTVSCICKRMQNRFQGFPKKYESRKFQMVKSEFDKKFKNENNPEENKNNHNFKTYLVVELMEKHPFKAKVIESGYKLMKKTSSTSSMSSAISDVTDLNESGTLDSMIMKKEDNDSNRKEFKMIRMRGIENLKAEIEQFYSCVTQRLEEFAGFYKKDSVAYKTIMMILQELEQEYSKLINQTQQVYLIFKQTEVFDKVSRRNFIDVKRKFYLKNIRKWEKLVHSLKTSLCLSKNDVFDEEVKLSLEDLVREYRILKKEKKGKDSI